MLSSSFIFRFSRDYWMEAAFMNSKRFMGKELLLVSLRYMGKLHNFVIIINCYFSDM